MTDVWELCRGGLQLALGKRPAVPMVNSDALSPKGILTAAVKVMTFTVLAAIFTGCTAFFPSRPASGLYMMVDGGAVIIRAAASCALPPGGFLRLELLVGTSNHDEVVWEVRSDGKSADEFEIGIEPDGFRTIVDLEQPLRDSAASLRPTGAFWTAVVDGAPSISFGPTELEDGFYSPDAPDARSESELRDVHPRTFGC